MKDPRTDKIEPKDQGSAATGPAGVSRSVLDDEQKPRMPHERDESTSAGGPRESMRIAHDDAVSEKELTDRSEATERVYSEALRSPTPGKERDIGASESERDE